MAGKIHRRGNDTVPIILTMDQSSRDFIDFQRSIWLQKKQLNSYLKAVPGRVFVYYLAPLSNIIKMRDSNLISPRNMVDEFSDLSDQTIQESREKKVELRNDRYIYQSPIHSCVNFFLNPLNKTYYAFRRNALIRNHDDPNSAVVGILEMDLEAMLDHNNIAWCVSDGNLAVGNTMGSQNYQELPWEDIYSVNLTTNFTNYQKDSSRSAEFLVYVDDNDEVGCVDFDSINRILVLDYDLNPIEPDFIEDLGIDPITNDKRVFVFGNPLHNDIQFAYQLSLIISKVDSKHIITRALRRLSRIENELSLNLKGNFSRPQEALNFRHGIGHVIRVMFWIVVLGEILKEQGYKIKELEITTALYAGFVHDLCRENDYAEAAHGRKATEKFNEHLRDHLTREYVNRCFTAITCHSVDEDPQKRDVVWALLKDADALDRGRFGKPYTTHGCNGNRLRLPIFSDDTELTNNILQASCLLPKLTGYINWSDDTCNDFVSTFLSSLECVRDCYQGKDPEWLKNINNLLATYQLLYG
ncbi:MAG: DarT ssDNA thymidine ADP-ribosyltransferase family protein [Anaerolineaceae bacterium]